MLEMNKKELINVYAIIREKIEETWEVAKSEEVSQNKRDSAMELLKVLHDVSEKVLKGYIES